MTGWNLFLTYIITNIKINSFFNTKGLFTPFFAVLPQVLVCLQVFAIFYGLLSTFVDRV